MIFVLISLYTFNFRRDSREKIKSKKILENKEFRKKILKTHISGIFLLFFYKNR